MDDDDQVALGPKNIRSARAILAWSRKDLADAAGVPVRVARELERARNPMAPEGVQAMRDALERAGVRFLPGGGVAGPDIPALGPSRGVGAPTRWISAEDLADWANRTDGANSLPTLIAYTVYATHGSQVRLRFPSDESVRRSGWDGRTSTDTESVYVPSGETGWEIGTQRRGIADKATEDFNKRTLAPSPVDPSTGTFIFVTPRPWPGKDSWASDRRAEGVWRDVRAYDADDLVHWVEQAPGVGLWLANRLGKRTPDLREVQDVWEAWALATNPPLTEGLVLSGRDEDAAAILRWLRGAPSVLSLQATTAEEIIAFFHAVIGELPERDAAPYRARSLVAASWASANALAEGPGPLIILMSQPDPGLARRLAGLGHYVLQAYDERLAPEGELRVLARPSREGIALALLNAGMPAPRAEKLARDSARNLAVLRRLIPSAPGRLPEWACGAPSRSLLAALLVGGWDEDCEGDRTLVSDVAAKPYETVTADLVPYVGVLDLPMRKFGSVWRMASPSDAWVLLSPHLTDADVSRFEQASLAVLGAPDPRFELHPSERWLAAVREVRPAHSDTLRNGVGQALILLALWGDKARMVSDPAQRVDSIVQRLLWHANERRWWSLSKDFRLLAEASPKAFLKAVELSLEKSAPPISVLFEVEDTGIVESHRLSDLLWALESLAWSSAWLTSVSVCLARLDALDRLPSRHGNRPTRSLNEIHLLWSPQTHAGLDQRLKSLDVVRRREGRAAWKLMIGLLPQRHGISFPTCRPRWRDFPVSPVEDVTWDLVGRGVAEVTNRLIEDVGVDPARWSLLLQHLADLAPDPEGAILALEAAEPVIRDEAERASLWASLRRTLHRHRQFPGADWALPDDVLARLEGIYERFAPSDPVVRVAWLFQPAVNLPKPSTSDFMSAQEEARTAREDAVRPLFAAGGPSAVLALARTSENPAFVAQAMHNSGVPQANLETLSERGVRSADERERGLARALIALRFHDHGEAWARTLIDRVREQGWGETALLAVFQALPGQDWTWAQVARAGDAVDRAYWLAAPVFGVTEASDTAFAIRKLNGVGRARHALALVVRAGAIDLPSDLIVQTLEAAVAKPPGTVGDSDDASMFVYLVTEIFQHLDRQSDVDERTLISLEWKYLYLLEHSGRPVRLLPKALSEQPKLFVEVVAAVYLPSEESGVVDPPQDDPERARAVASLAYKLLELWDHLPGTRDDGAIDAAVLASWIEEARTRAHAAGRGEVADSRIGRMLSASPHGHDGNWPAEAVREAIERFDNPALIDGFWIGKSNRRGITSRMPDDGGRLERNEAAQYRRWAEAIADEHPRTAEALETLAESYERQARRFDDDVERRDLS